MKFGMRKTIAIPLVKLIDRNATASRQEVPSDRGRLSNTGCKINDTINAGVVSDLQVKVRGRSSTSVFICDICAKPVESAKFMRCQSISLVILPVLERP